jgi:hypothetical protein
MGGVVIDLGEVGSDMCGMAAEMSEVAFDIGGVAFDMIRVVITTLFGRTVGLIPGGLSRTCIFDESAILMNLHL